MKSKKQGFTIQSKVKERMEAAGFSVRGMASQTGLSTGTLHRVRGALIARCTLETMATIAQALGCRVKDLFEEAGPK